MAENKAKKTEVVKVEKAAPPALYDYGSDAGRGWQNTDQEHFKVPFLNQVQNTSAEIIKGDPKYIEGAEPGMYFNSVSRMLYQGTEIFLVPCYTKHHYTEWPPRGGGNSAPLGIHAIRSEVVLKAKQRAGEETGETWKDLKTEKGNTLDETFEIYALRLDDPDDEEPAEMLVLSFSRTKIKRYKDIMTTLRSFKGSGKIPLFAHRLRMFSTDEKGSEGPYKNVRLEPAVEKKIETSLIPPTSPLLEAGRTFEEMVSSGDVQADYESTKQDDVSVRNEDADDILG